MDAFEIFENKAAEIVGDKQRGEAARFEELKAPFLQLRTELQTALKRYHEVRPAAIEFTSRIGEIPWRALGFFTPPGHVLHYLGQLKAMIACDGKPIANLILDIDGLTLEDFKFGPAVGVPLTILEESKGVLRYADSLTQNMRALREELEKYAGRIKAGVEWRDVQIAAEAMPELEAPKRKPRKKIEYQIFEGEAKS